MPQNPCIAMYRLLCMFANAVGTTCCLQSSYLRMFLTDPTAVGDMAVHTKRPLSIDEADSLYDMLRHVGWASNWWNVTGNITCIDATLLNVKFVVTIHPAPPRDVFFDVDNIMAIGETITAAVPHGPFTVSSVFNTMSAIWARQASVLTDMGDLDDFELANFLVQQIALQKAGYTVTGGATIVPLPDGDVCPITLHHTLRGVRLRCGHAFDIDALVLLLRRKMDSDGGQKCPVCRKYVTV